MTRITRGDREGAERYTQLVSGTPLDDRGEVELTAFARLSTRELDVLVADLIASETELPVSRTRAASLRHFLRGELGFAAALLAAFALIAVFVVAAAALSNDSVVAPTSSTGQTANTTTGHSATNTSVRPGVVTGDYGSGW